MECNPRPACAGTKVATALFVEPEKSDEQLSIAWPTDERPALAQAPLAVVVKAGQPRAGRSPLVPIAIVGAVAGGVATLAFVSVQPRSDTHIQTTPPAITAAAPAVVESIPVPSIPAPTWVGARRASWSRDGSKTIAFHLAATRDLSVWMNKARPVLGARCLYRATEVFVMLDTSASFENDADRRTVRVQWDDESPSVQQWGVSESGKELFAPDAKAFIERMARARRLQFGFTPFNAEPVTAEFDVAGFDRLAGLVTGTCRQK